MSTTENVLDQAKQLVQARLTELDEERKRLENALKELGGKAPRRSPGRPRGSRTSTSSASSPGPRRRRKRRDGTPTRSEQMLAIVGEQPGVGTSDVAETLDIKANYLYRLTGDAEKEGLIRKDGRQLYLTEAGEKAVADSGVKAPERKAAPAAASPKKPKAAKAKKAKAAKKTTSA